MEKFYYICRANFTGKDNVDFYTIDFYVEEIDCVVKNYVSKQVYNNYNNVARFSEISKNKIAVEKRKNKYNQIVVSYKIIN